MAYVDLYPAQGQLYHPNTGWQSISGYEEIDGVYAMMASGFSTQKIVLQNWSAGLPQDVSISGMAVLVDGKFSPSGLGSTTTKFAASLASGGVTLTETKLSGNLTASDAQYLIGADGQLWSYTGWKRSLFHNNPNVQLILEPSGDTGSVRLLDRAVIRVYYTLNTSLRGERSSFPPPLSQWPVVSPRDVLPRQVNSAAASSQITAEDMNFLGDCAYNIQTTVLASSGMVRAAGVPDTVLGGMIIPHSVLLTTVTITGSVSSASAYSTGFLRLGQVYNYDVTTDTLLSSTRSVDAGVTLTSVLQNTASLLPPQKQYMGLFSGGIGWVATASGYVGLNVTPSLLRLERGPVAGVGADILRVAWGFTAHMGSLAIDTNIVRNGRYGALYVPRQVPDGLLCIKLSFVGAV